MKRIPGTHNEYYVVEVYGKGLKQKKKLRLWHDCTKYKNGRHGNVRVELEKRADYKFLCPHCEFIREGNVENF